MNAIIIDDERLARNDLKAALQAFPAINITGEAGNVQDALALMAEQLPEVIFLDIEMPGQSGFDLLEKLETVPEVIFTTAYHQYAIKAFEINALDYLLKPVTANRLQSAIERLQQKLAAKHKTPAGQYLDNSEKVFVKDGERCWFVAISQIRLFESAGSYIRIYFDRHSPLVLRSITAMEERLDPSIFFRASRKHIVNLEHVQHIETLPNHGLILTLTDGKTVEVSRRQAIRFRELRSI